MQQHNLSNVSIQSGPSSGFDKNLYINVDKTQIYLFLNSVHDCVFGRLEGVGRLDGVWRLVVSIVLGGTVNLVAAKVHSGSKRR